MQSGSPRQERLTSLFPCEGIREKVYCFREDTKISESDQRLRFSEARKMLKCCDCRREIRGGPHSVISFCTGVTFVGIRSTERQ
ncbi:hypothetical protein RRG08_012410 [Elysia crispata]|uniref:Uncharacterized protein n=1 Tax=Elysia crispata TaxID=231223 RepID=A0AAE0YL33_9GAST|nr:hypothetical protein RRG08_012410 [Elysia crispata]